MIEDLKFYKHGHKQMKIYTSEPFLGWNYVKEIANKIRYLRICEELLKGVRWLFMECHYNKGPFCFFRPWALKRLGPVLGILIDRCEKSAYYTVADYCTVNFVMDGMNLVPYEYIVCRQGSTAMDEAIGIKSDSPRTIMLVVSEFIHCSPSSCKAIRVNPWDICSVAEAMYSAISISGGSWSHIIHEKHYQYAKSRDVAYSASSFMEDMEIACKDHYGNQCLGLSFGLIIRLGAFSPGFKKLSTEYIISSYTRTNRRAIFLDFDGTLVPLSSINKTPSSAEIALNTLCNVPKNTIFIVNG